MKNKKDKQPIIAAVLLNDERHKRWIETSLNALYSEIETLVGQDPAQRIEKPFSPIFERFVKIQSIVKGYNLDRRFVGAKVAFAIRSHVGAKNPRNINYQLDRAYKLASPRRLETDSHE